MANKNSWTQGVLTKQYDWYDRRLRLRPRRRPFGSSGVEPF